MSEQIRISIANEGEVDIDLETLKNFKITNISQVGDTVFFNVGKTQISMKLIDFNKVYKV